ncbi:RNI-like protein [Imleria badia]|nr:RNI-like protein [Imleria badia]
MQLKLSSRSSPKWRHKYHQDPATICSAVNYTLQNISPRLASTWAVNAITTAIRKRQVVHRLYLGASSLGDAGCVRLFEFLASPAGLHCRDSLTELFLTKNEIGAQGLLAVAAFLRGNTVLRELCLSGNPLTTDPDVIAEFASALNSSRLCTLQILHCSTLGDSFAQVFLPQLATPYLRELDLSAINMTQAIVPTLADYVRSSRCRLERLQCNANSLTLSGACKIVRAIEENCSLRSVRLDDLHIDDHAAAAAAAAVDRTIGWQGCNRALSAVLERNSVYTARVRDESLALLRYSRALFLRSRTGGAKNGHTFASLSRSSRSSQSFDAPSPFFDLPAELQQEIISYLAPSLSHQQRMRIIYFAADITTLFPADTQSNEIRGRTKQREALVKTGRGLRSHSQQGQPFEGTWRPPMWWKCRCSTELRPSCRCLRRWKRERRDIWLTQVACDTYEHVV